MNQNHVKGTLHGAKGRVKEAVGHATGNTSLESEGILERVKGKVYQGLGDFKDVVKRKVDGLLAEKPSRKRG